MAAAGNRSLLKLTMGDKVYHKSASGWERIVIDEQ